MRSDSLQVGLHLDFDTVNEFFMGRISATAKPADAKRPSLRQAGSHYH
jgi:hypothetical protein